VSEGADRVRASSAERPSQYERTGIMGGCKKGDDVCACAPACAALSSAVSALFASSRSVHSFSAAASASGAGAVVLSWFGAKNVVLPACGIQ
jgi:hypothetical protein